MQYQTDLLSAKTNSMAVHIAGKLLADGKPVVIPTETVYGLAASAVDKRAVLQVFRIKNRPADNPLIVHFASVDHAFEVVPRHFSLARELLQVFAPGPITVVVPAAEWIVSAVCGNGTTMALRVPSHECARGIIDAAQVPLAAPSANRSGRPSPTSAAMALDEMRGHVPLIVDGGECVFGIESTVVSTIGNHEIRILRAGHITAEQIQEALQCRVTAADGVYGKCEKHSISSNGNGNIAVPVSPGTKYTHYQPAIPVILCRVEDWAEASAEALRCGGGLLLAEASAAGTNSTIHTDAAQPSWVLCFDTWYAYAAGLYKAFWQAERKQMRYILALSPSTAEHAALADRLFACKYTTIQYRRNSQ